jgi:hypothetical protein
LDPGNDDAADMLAQVDYLKRASASANYRTENRNSRATISS